MHGFGNILKKIPILLQLKFIMFQADYSDLVSMVKKT